MLRFDEPVRQHNLSATLRADVRAMPATTVTPRLNVAEHPKRSLAFSEFSVVMTCWTLKVHLVVYDLKVTLVAQIVKRDNVEGKRVQRVDKPFHATALSPPRSPVWYFADSVLGLFKHKIVHKCMCFCIGFQIRFRADELVTRWHKP